MERKQRKVVQNQIRKRQIVQNWLSSFLVTTVVATAVIVAPALPSAAILQLENIGTDIYYNVEVLNQQENTQNDTLKIVAKSNLDEYENSLDFGQTDGYFYDLLPNTEYEISILISTGFGDKSLTKQSVKTSSLFDGKIIEASVYDDEYGQTLICDVDLMYSDHKNQLQSVYVLANFHMTNTDEDEYVYELEPQIVQEKQFSFSLFDIPKFNGYIELSLEGISLNNQAIILDQKIVCAPLIENALFYNGNITSATFYSDEYQETILCDINLVYEDYKSQLQSIYVVANYYMTNMQETEEVFVVELETQIVDNKQFSYTLPDIPIQNGYLSLSLQGVLTNDEVVILDEQTFYAPYIVNAYPYIDYVGENMVSAVLYPDEYLQNESYYAVLKKDGQIIEQKNIELVVDEYEYEIGYLIFENLQVNSTYVLEFWANFTNPYTLEPQTSIIYSFEFLTNLFIPC